MTKQEALEQLLPAYHRYYNINRETPAAPFAAEAIFQTHDESYFLLKSAKLAESDSKEFVFFALEDRLTPERVRELQDLAWMEGCSRMEIRSGHKNSDVVLIVLSDHVEEAAAAQIESIKLTKNYKFGLWGWSNFKMIAYDLSTGKSAHNRLGADLKKVLNNIRNQPAHL